MENDLISRNSLKEKIENIMTWHDEYEESEWLSCAEEIINLLTDEPAVELDGYVLYGTGLELVSTDWLDEQLGKDRRRGKWVEKRDTNGRLQLYCNQCGAKAQVGFVSFCGKCGADMRGDKND